MGMLKIIEWKDNSSNTIVHKIDLKKDYIKPLKGSVEYYHHLNSNIPRIERLIKNLYKYIILKTLHIGYRLRGIVVYGYTLQICNATPRSANV